MPNSMPRAYSHLSAAEYALQKELNSQPVIIKTEQGEQLKGDNCAELLTAFQIRGITAAYNFYNKTDDRTNYIIKVKPSSTAGRTIATIETFKDGLPVTREIMV